MNMSSMTQVLLKLRPSERLVVYQSAGGVHVTVTHTGRFSAQDYAVGLVIPGRPEFYPTHVRLLFDLYLKRLSNPEGASEIFSAMELIFDGDDPERLGGRLSHLSFPMMLDEAAVNLVYAQLLMIEQDFNFGWGPGATKISKLNPPREFLMRFIRWVASGDDEIDKIVTNAVRNWPPPARYTRHS